MSVENLIKAGVFYGSFKLASSISKSLADGKLRQSLEGSFSPSFTDHFMQVLSSTPNNTDVETLLTDEVAKHVYRSLFRHYNESTADFFLAKYQKAKTMGVEYNYDTEISQFLAEKGISSESPYSTAMQGILKAAPPPRNEAFEECVRMADTPITSGKLPTDGFFVKPGHIFNGKKYTTVEEASQERSKLITGLATPSLVAYVRQEIGRFRSDLVGMERNFSTAPLYEKADLEAALKRQRLVVVAAEAIASST